MLKKKKPIEKTNPIEKKKPFEKKPCFCSVSKIFYKVFFFAVFL